MDHDNTFMGLRWNGEFKCMTCGITTHPKVSLAATVDDSHHVMKRYDGNGYLRHQNHVHGASFFPRVLQTPPASPGALESLVGSSIKKSRHPRGPLSDPLMNAAQFSSPALRGPLTSMPPPPTLHQRLQKYPAVSDHKLRTEIPSAGPPPCHAELRNRMEE